MTRLSCIRSKRHVRISLLRITRRKKKKVAVWKRKRRKRAILSEKKQKLEKRRPDFPILFSTFLVFLSLHSERLLQCTRHIIPSHCEQVNRFLESLEHKYLSQVRSWSVSLSCVVHNVFIIFVLQLYKLTCILYIAARLELHRLFRVLCIYGGYSNHKWNSYIGKNETWEFQAALVRKLPFAHDFDMLRDVFWLTNWRNIFSNNLIMTVTSQSKCSLERAPFILLW